MIETDPRLRIDRTGRRSRVPVLLIVFLFAFIPIVVWVAVFRQGIEEAARAPFAGRSRVVAVAGGGTERLVLVRWIEDEISPLWLVRVRLGALGRWQAFKQEADPRVQGSGDDPALGIPTACEPMPVTGLPFIDERGACWIRAMNVLVGPSPAQAKTVEIAYADGRVTTRPTAGGYIADIRPGESIVRIAFRDASGKLLDSRASPSVAAALYEAVASAAGALRCRLDGGVTGCGRDDPGRPAFFAHVSISVLRTDEYRNFCGDAPPGDYVLLGSVFDPRVTEAKSHPGDYQGDSARILRGDPVTRVALGMRVSGAPASEWVLTSTARRSTSASPCFPAKSSAPRFD